jgi:hypothetical protein
LADLRNQREVLDAFTDTDAGVDVRAVFSSSVWALSEPAAELFCLLSLHQATSADEAVAARVVGRPVASVRRLLAELSVGNLTISAAPEKYKYHALVRHYASELAAELPPEHRRAAVRRLRDHYAANADDTNFADSRRRHLTDTRTGACRSTPMPTRAGVGAQL